MIHRLEQEQIIPAPLERVWAYFATPANLDEMTPDHLRFRIVHGAGEAMHQGQLIEYRVRVAPLVWTTWLTEIRQVREGAFFVDEQRAGPYRFWYHEHRFEAIPGGVRMTDRVTYDVGLGPLGALLHRFWIRPRLEGIFAFRRAQVARLFPG